MPVVELSLRELINPTERQAEYLESSDRHRFTLFGGARGGGKSYIERWRQVRFLLRLTALGIKGVQTGLFSSTFKESRKRQFLPAKAEFPEWLGSFNESNLEFTFSQRYGGHRIAFLNLEDPSQYKSDQFATIGIEEITLCPASEILDILCGSLRWPGVDWTPFCATTNPDGPGHSWVKGLWVTKTLFDHPDHAKKKPEHFNFVRSLPTDNPHLPETYITEILEGLPDSLREPWLKGSWDLFQGQRFVFNPAIHFVDPFDIPAPVNYYASIDYGFDNPFALGIYAVLGQPINGTQIYKIYETAVSGLKAREQAQLVKDVLAVLKIRLAQPAYLDTACWKEEDDGLSIAQKFIQEGLPVQKVLKDRVNGWVSLEDLIAFKQEKGEITRQPKMKFFRNCVLTAQQITDALWDPKKPGDILHPEGFRDDCLDETRYFGYTHFHAPKVVEEIPVDSMAYLNKLAQLQYGKKAKVPKYL